MIKKEDVTIGIITALEIEFAAVETLLENCKRIPIKSRKKQLSVEKYALGEIPTSNGEKHLIALALSGQGNNKAAIRASRLLEQCPNIECVIMVGIAGAVPNPEKPDEHVRLGDIVVSNEQGVIQYDYIKETRRTIIHRVPPRAPIASLVKAVSFLSIDEMKGARPWDKFIEFASNKLGVKRPPAKTDFLGDSKDPKKKIPHPRDKKRIKNLPRVFQGPIGAANILQKNPIQRDKLRDKYGLKAIEMEGSGIADATFDYEIGFFIIRGTCDYCDDHKNDIWQRYAAIAAAAYTIALLESITSEPEKSYEDRNFHNNGLPTSECKLFGRASQFRILNSALKNKKINIVTIVAWAGVGKTALLKHWIKAIRIKSGFSIKKIFIWSFYKQGFTERIVSADLFVEKALDWFGDTNSNIGTPWEKGERLAKLINAENNLLILDGLEPLQYPPGPHEGKLKDVSMSALFQSLAISNKGLCVVSTRLPLTDIAEYQDDTVKQIDLECLCPEDGAQLLRAMGVKGSESELQKASLEFGGHCLALNLLGSYLKDVCGGDVIRRSEIKSLQDDVRYGGQAKRVMASYEKWFGQGPECDLLCLVGLFDRPIERDALHAIASSKIVGLNEHLCKLNKVAIEQTIAKLNRSKLIIMPRNEDSFVLDAHPLVKEYFSKKLMENKYAWKMGNYKLYEYYKDASANIHPETIEEMDNVFLANIYGAKAGKYQETLSKIYMSRIISSEYFASNQLGSFGAMLSVLEYYFQNGDWAKPVNELNKKEKIFVLTEAGQYLTATRGYAASDVYSCYETARKLSNKIVRNKNAYYYKILLGLCRYFRMRGDLRKSWRYANQLNELSKLNKKLVPVARRAAASYFFYTGEFEKSMEYSLQGITKYKNVNEALENAQLDLNEPIISCKGYLGLNYWFLGKSEEGFRVIDEALENAEALAHAHTLAVALFIKAIINQFSRNFDNVAKTSKDLIEICARKGFGLWQAAGEILQAWAQIHHKRNLSSEIRTIQEGIDRWKSNDAKLFMPYWQGILADVYLSNRQKQEGLCAIEEGLSYSKKNGERWWDNELYRLKESCARN